MSQKLSQRWLNKVRADAAKRHISFDEGLTLEVLQEIFDAQGGCCAISGIKLRIVKSGRNPQSTLSLDRKSSRLGYTVANVHFVSKKVNMAKGRLTQSEFLKICRRVAEYNL